MNSVLLMFFWDACGTFGWSSSPVWSSETISKHRFATFYHRDMYQLSISIIMLCNKHTKLQWHTIANIYFTATKCHLYNYNVSFFWVGAGLWLLQSSENGGRDTMWLPKLSHKRPCSFCLVLWNTCSGGCELTSVRSLITLKPPDCVEV